MFYCIDHFAMEMDQILELLELKLETEAISFIFRVGLNKDFAYKHW